MLLRASGRAAGTHAREPLVHERGPLSNVQQGDGGPPFVELGVMFQRLQQRTSRDPVGVAVGRRVGEVVIGGTDGVPQPVNEV